MFPTSYLMRKRRRNQTKFRYIIVPYGHVHAPLRIPLRLWSLLIFSNLLLLIHTSVHFSLFLLFFCYLLCFSNSFVFSSSFFLKLMTLLSFLNPPHCIIMTQYVFQSLLSLVYHEKIIRSLSMLIFFRVRPKGQFTIDFFSKHPLLKTHSNKEHDNEKLQPQNPEIIEELFEWIIHSVPSWIFCDWECVLNVYLFMTEFLEDILDLHPLLFFVW